MQHPRLLSPPTPHSQTRGESCGICLQNTPTNPPPVSTSTQVQATSACARDMAVTCRQVCLTQLGRVVRSQARTQWVSPGPARTPTGRCVLQLLPLCSQLRAPVPSLWPSALGSPRAQWAPISGPLSRFVCRTPPTPHTRLTARPPLVLHLKRAPCPPLSCHSLSGLPSPLSTHQLLTGGGWVWGCEAMRAGSVSALFAAVASALRMSGTHPVSHFK